MRLDPQNEVLTTDAGEDWRQAIDAELNAWEQAERERLGLRQARRQWVDEMLTPEVKREERETVTLLVSGLTAAQDFLVEGALRGVGYNVKYIGMPDQAGLQAGKEFGNRGQCNPTYFTVGNLIKYLIELRDVQGLSTQQIIRDYVFFTAGACGPCRFGMYVTEYRKALRDSGFDGFRVVLFQQQGGLAQATGEEVGIELNPKFFIALIQALCAGDVLNAIAYRIRPYEVNAGETNRVVEDCKRLLYKALQARSNIFAALWQCRKRLAAVPVDRLRAKAKVAIIGEFWAMTTEGDGNYHLQKFLEQEGGENDIQLTTAWLLYNVWEVERDTRVRRDLRQADGGRLGLADYSPLAVSKRLAMMRLADRGLRLMFEAFAQPIGLTKYPLPNMDEIAEIAAPFYSNDLRGGEGHMEVGKLIYNVVHAKAHMTLSVKPFGCMPSSGVSDGVQSLVQTRFPGSIYCAVETSGDGATNFYSRVQMYMFKARIAAEQELVETYASCGVTEDEVRAFLAKNPKYASPLHVPPHVGACTAANLVREVAPLIRQTRAERAAARTRGALERVGSMLRAAPDKARAIAAWAQDDATRERLSADVALVRELAQGGARDAFAPLLRKLGAGGLVPDAKA